METICKFMLFFVILLLEINICAELYIKKIQFDCVIIFIIVFIKYII